jgi:hypothetical protein
MIAYVNLANVKDLSRQAYFNNVVTHEKSNELLDSITLTTIETTRISRVYLAST